MPCMSRPQIRAAGAVVFRRAEGGVQLLVLRAYSNWEFPKGRLEADETDFECAQREVWEETGLTDLAYPFDEAFQETLPYAAGNKIARYYLAQTETAVITLPKSPDLGRPEHDEWRWVSFEQAEDLLPPRLAIVLDWARHTLTGN